MVWLLALILGLAVRLAPITAAKPYIAYINEGNFLHPVVGMLRAGRWDPRAYEYPQFPRIAVAAVVRTYAPIYRFIHGRKIRSQYSPEPGVYDVLEPFDVLVAGRAMSILAAMGTVVLTGVLAHRLAGPHAGGAAVALAAVTPALAVRGAFATVDPYAALFVIACLIATDRTRTSARPGYLSFWAGCFAGCAFASKYPGVIVGIAFGVTTLLQRIPWREKLRRAALATVGLICGIVVAMPAVVAHPLDVYSAIHDQAASYAGLTTPSLWQQAIKTAEPNMPYSESELGVIYVGLAAIGCVVALADRRFAPTIWGWIAFAVVSLGLFAHYPYQPFRNLLPLVPLGSVVVALLYVRIRERVRRPVLIDLAGSVAIIGFFAVPMIAYAWERMHVVDSRTTVMDWLVASTRPDDSVVLVKELGFVSSELARLPKPPTLQSWREGVRSILESRPSFIVTGVSLQENGTTIDTATQPSITAMYEVRLRLGDTPTAQSDLWWRGNQEILYVLERKKNVSP